MCKNVNSGIMIGLVTIYGLTILFSLAALAWFFWSTEKEKKDHPSTISVQRLAWIGSYISYGSVSVHLIAAAINLLTCTYDNGDGYGDSERDTRVYPLGNLYSRALTLIGLFATTSFGISFFAVLCHRVQVTFRGSAYAIKRWILITTPSALVILVGLIWALIILVSLFAPHLWGILKYLVAFGVLIFTIFSLYILGIFVHKLFQVSSSVQANAMMETLKGMSQDKLEAMSHRVNKSTTKIRSSVASPSMDMTAAGTGTGTGLGVPGHIRGRSSRGQSITMFKDKMVGGLNHLRDRMSVPNASTSHLRHVHEKNSTETHLANGVVTQRGGPIPVLGNQDSNGLGGISGFSGIPLNTIPDKKNPSNRPITPVNNPSKASIQQHIPKPQIAQRINSLETSGSGSGSSSSDEENALRKPHVVHPRIDSGDDTDDPYRDDIASDSDTERPSNPNANSTGGPMLKNRFSNPTTSSKLPPNQSMKTQESTNTLMTPVMSPQRGSISENEAARFEKSVLSTTETAKPPSNKDDKDDREQSPPIKHGTQTTITIADIHYKTMRRLRKETEIGGKKKKGSGNFLHAITKYTLLTTIVVLSTFLNAFMWAYYGSPLPWHYYIFDIFDSLTNIIALSLQFTFSKNIYTYLCGFVHKRCGESFTYLADFHLHRQYKKNVENDETFRRKSIQKYEDAYGDESSDRRGGNEEDDDDDGSDVDGRGGGMMKEETQMSVMTKMDVGSMAVVDNRHGDRAGGLTTPKPDNGGKAASNGIKPAVSMIAEGGHDEEETDDFAD